MNCKKIKIASEFIVCAIVHIYNAVHIRQCLSCSVCIYDSVFLQCVVHLRQRELPEHAGQCGRLPQPTCASAGWTESTCIRLDVQYGHVTLLNKGKKGRGVSVITVTQCGLIVVRQKVKC